MALREGDNVCGVCGENFASTQLFDWHRTGKHGYLADDLFLDGRRCRTLAEIAERGLVRNRFGQWHDAEHSQRVAAYMAEKRERTAQEAQAA